MKRMTCSQGCESDVKAGIGDLSEEKSHLVITRIRNNSAVSF